MFFSVWFTFKWDYDIQEHVNSWAADMDCSEKVIIKTVLLVCSHFTVAWTLICLPIHNIPPMSSMQSRRLASLPNKCFPWDFLQKVGASASLPPTPPTPPSPPHTTPRCWISSPNIYLAVRAAPFSVFCSLAAKNFNCIAVDYIVYTHGLDWIPFSYKNESRTTSLSGRYGRSLTKFLELEATRKMATPSPPPPPFLPG